MVTLKENGMLPEELVEVPTFLNTPNCDATLVEETRQLLRQRHQESPDNFYQADVDLLLTDDWTMSRFLLRCRLNPSRSVDLIEAAAKFRKEYKMGAARLSDFPAELHQVGGIFQYAPDRVGNVTLWMRVKYHKRSTEMDYFMKQFILCVMEQCDKASKGRGVAVIFDLTGCGVRNVDPAFLYWLLYSFRNFCPKGLSYILVYNLPYVMSAICSLALSWLSNTNRKRLRFIEGERITKFIAPENLPNFVMGGLCTLPYNCVPDGSEPVKPKSDDELVPISDELALKIRQLYGKIVDDNKVAN